MNHTFILLLLVYVTGQTPGDIEPELKIASFEPGLMDSSLRSFAKSALSKLLVNSGVVAWYERSHHEGLQIINYHRVLPASRAKREAFHKMICHLEVFERQIEAISQRYEIIPLSSLAEINGAPVSDRPQVAITFDDGYRDVYEYAFPVLKRYGVPATIFLNTGPIDWQTYLWWDDLAYLLTRSQNNWEIPSGAPEPVRPALQAVKRACGHEIFGAISNVCTELNRLPMQQINIILSELRQACVAGSNGCGPPLMLDWDQVRTMKANGLVEFGAHTVNHPFLDELSADEIQREALESRRRIEAELDEEVTMFSYPSGRYNETVKYVLRDLGFRVAVTTEQGRNYSQTDPLQLKRMDAGFLSANSTLFDEALMACQLSGAYDAVNRVFAKHKQGRLTWRPRQTA